MYETNLLSNVYIRIQANCEGCSSSETQLTDQTLSNSDFWFITSHEKYFTKLSTDRNIEFGDFIVCPKKLN